MENVYIYLEMYSKSNENNDKSNCAAARLNLGLMQEDKIPVYADMIADIDKEKFAEMAGLDVIEDADFRFITKEEYDMRYAGEDLLSDICSGGQ